MLSETWSDYDGDWVYGDYVVDPSTGDVTEKRAYLPGIARVDNRDEPGFHEAWYYHTDLIGTTRFTTDSLGFVHDELVYTAFGEKVGGTDRRYGYAGSWGYQSTMDDSTGTAVFPFLHVGHRYYDPAIGRFLQRDPVGLRAGLNVYAYVFNMPTVGVDPFGRGFWSRIGRGVVGAVVGAVIGTVTGGGIPGAIGGAIAGGVGGALSDSLGGAVVVGAVSGIGGGIGAAVGRGAISAGTGIALNAGVGAGATALRGGSPTQVVLSGALNVGGGMTALGLPGRLPLKQIGTPVESLAESLFAVTNGITINTACGVAELF